VRARFLIPFILLVGACGRTETVAGPRSDRSFTKPASAPFSASGPQQGAPLGLTGCWSGDGNATDVVFGNNGTVVGPVSYAPGKFGLAFSFNGPGGDVLIAQSSTLDVMRGGGITLAAWFYPKGQAFGSVAGSGPILEYENGAHIWQTTQIQQVPWTTFFTDMAASANATDFHILEAPGTVTQNAWNHGVATYSKTSGNITAYINGVQVAQKHVGLINPLTAAPFHIGSRAPVSFGGTQYTFNGLIDEAQVYNRELTSAEVAQIASATTPLCTTPSQIAILTQPAGAANGVPLTTQPALQLLDAAGVPVTFARFAVTATIASGAGTLLGTTTANAVNGIATFTNLQITGANAGTRLGFSAPGVTAVQSSSILVVQVVNQIVVTSLPGSVTSGVALSPPPTVELRDADGFKVASATNAVTVSIGSGTGTLSGTTTVNAVAGVATFSGLIITGTGPNTLSFALAGSGGITVVGTPLNVVANTTPPTQLGITTQPLGAETGVAFAVQPVVVIRDATGALVPSATNAVTVAIATGTGTLSGTTTVNAVNGIATFSGLTIGGPGTYRLRFTSTGLTSVTSASFTVTQGVRQLVITKQPGGAASYQYLTSQPVIELRDATGAKVSGATNAVTVAIATGNGTLTGTLTVNAVQGTAKFTDLVVSGSGAQTLRFSAAPPTGPVSVNSASFTVSPAPTYSWSGFFDDVDAPPKLNRAKAGKEIDLEFGLGGDMGSNIFAAGSPASRPISCTTLASLGGLVPLVISSDDGNGDHGNGDHGNGDHGNGDHGSDKNKDSSSLSYNRNNRHYTLQWQTSKSFDDSCRAVVLTLADGSTHTAYFNFSK
jgi:hypothetical protein